MSKRTDAAAGREAVEKVLSRPHPDDTLAEAVAEIEGIYET